MLDHADIRIDVIESKKKIFAHVTLKGRRPVKSLQVKNALLRLGHAGSDPELAPEEITDPELAPEAELAAAKAPTPKPKTTTRTRKPSTRTRKPRVKKTPTNNNSNQ